MFFNKICISLKIDVKKLVFYVSITKKLGERKTMQYNIAIVGATGMVGRTFLQVLEEYKLEAHYYLFSSARSAGKKLTFLGKEYVVEELTEDNITPKKSISPCSPRCMNH
jgi:NADPH:quinone reductase-like Zn-dependent oxidoreductase